MMSQPASSLSNLFLVIRPLVYPWITHSLLQYILSLVRYFHFFSHPCTIYKDCRHLKTWCLRMVANGLCGSLFFVSQLYRLVLHHDWPCWSFPCLWIWAIYSDIPARSLKCADFHFCFDVGGPTSKIVVQHWPHSKFHIEIGVPTYFWMTIAYSNWKIGYISYRFHNIPINTVDGRNSAPVSILFIPF